MDGTDNYAYATLDKILSGTHPSFQDSLEKSAYDSTGYRLAGLGFTRQYKNPNQLIEDDIAGYAYDDDGILVLKVNKVGGNTTRFRYYIKKSRLRLRSRFRSSRRGADNDCKCKN